MERLCEFPECGRSFRARGMCASHWAQWRKGFDLVPIGSTPLGQKVVDPAARFWRHVTLGPDCWLWTGATNGRGYGHFNAGKRRYVGAHVFAWELENGPVPDGLHLDHVRCQRPLCVRSSHLEPVPFPENIRRGYVAAGMIAPGNMTLRRDRCKRRHSLDDAYLAHRSNGTMSRRCRTCARDREQARKAAA